MAHGNVIFLRRPGAYSVAMKRHPFSSRLRCGFARPLLSLLSLLLLLGAILPGTLRASSDGMDAYAPENVARIDILPGWRLPDGRHMAALRIRLADGWKTYWRAPGDSGIPPAFDWTGSRNMEGVSILWPTPRVFDPEGLRTIGYERELVLPMAISPRRDGGPISIRGRVALGVCRDVCMPMEAEFSARLPASGEGPGSAAIRAALARLPRSGVEAGLREISCDVEPIADGLRVTARLVLPPLGRDEVAVIEPPDQTIWVSPTELTRSGDRLTLVSDLVPANGRPFALSRSDIRISVFAEGRGVDIASCLGS